MSQASFLSIQGLWAGPWLRDVIGLSRAVAAALLFWVAVSMIIGWIVSGWSAGRLAARGISLMTTTVSYLCIFMILQILLMLVPVSWNTTHLVPVRFFRGDADYRLCGVKSDLSAEPLGPGHHRGQSAGFRGRLFRRSG